MTSRSRLSLSLSVSLPFPVDWLPKPAYLVGGAVRDRIRQQLSESQEKGSTKLDLDLVLERSAVEWASATARRLQGGFVVLDPKRQIARIVLEHTTLDVALQTGDSLEADLYHRDFTCNAIALELHSQTLIDPLQGSQDIARRQIRMVHPDNLSDDPLRLLRAYRQAAQLGFELDPETQREICLRRSLINTVAAERVREEICYLLAVPFTGLERLRQAWQDGLLQGWLPCLNSTGFGRAMALERLTPSLTRRYPRSFRPLQEPITDQRPFWLTVLLTALLAADDQVEMTLDRLRFSRVERRTAQRLHLLQAQFFTLVKQKTEFLDREDYYHFYEAASFLFPAVALLVRSVGIPEVSLLTWLERYEDPNDPLAHQVPLLDGRQVMQALGLRPSPRVGEVLAAVRLAQAKGEITSQEEALSLVRRELRV